LSLRKAGDSSIDDFEAEKPWGELGSKRPNAPLKIGQVWPLKKERRLKSPQLASIFQGYFLVGFREFNELMFQHFLHSSQNLIHRLQLKLVFLHIALTTLMGATGSSLEEGSTDRLL